MYFLQHAFNKYFDQEKNNFSASFKARGLRVGPHSPHMNNSWEGGEKRRARERKNGEGIP